MNELERLRAEVAKRRKAVGSKISRIKRTSGAAVSGSEFDPRRSAGVEKRYNRAQLQSYLNQLNAFNARNVQFVPGTRGKPLPRHRWEYAQRLRGELQNIGERHARPMENVMLTPDMSLADLNAMRNKRLPGRTSRQVLSGPYIDFNSRSNEITSPKALERLIGDIKKQLNPRYFEKKLEQGRDNLIKALETMGDQESVKTVAGLSDFQFDVLWFGHPTVIEGIFIKYDLEKKRNSGERQSSKEDWQDRRAEERAEEFVQFLNDVKSTVPTDRPATSQIPTTKASKTNRTRRR